MNQSSVANKLSPACPDFLLLHMWTVYILLCSDGTHYVGCTSDINERMQRHARGEVHYTSTRLPALLIHQSVFADKQKAFQKSNGGVAQKIPFIFCRGKSFLLQANDSDQPLRL